MHITRTLAALALVGGLCAADTIAVVVNAEQQPKIQTALDTYLADLKAEGYATKLKSWDMATADQQTPAQLKAWLKGAGIQGAVFIGRVPVANVNSSTDSYQKNFVSDIYYMDLGTTWADANADGRFEQPAVKDLEIWVSRISGWGFDTKKTGTDEAGLTNRYLDKAHRFRTGELRLPPKSA